MGGRLPAAVAIIVPLLLVGCDKPEEVSSHSQPVPSSVFDPMALEIIDANLIKGREIWVRTCAQCHIRGLGGAPIIADKADWAPRILQGKEVLYDHAINGFVGPQLNEMPAKGGFLDLTDEEVKLAVDFVVFASE
ncbi:MAG TPA: cytochrome c5 family protein [Opitutae bacterium]|nr:cytochrome c5 family protein [Opitutae bacterium]